MQRADLQPAGGLVRRSIAVVGIGLLAFFVSAIVGRDGSCLESGDLVLVVEGCEPGR